MHALHALIGLGPGLTPSGDDLLGGVLVALHLLGRPDLAEALWHGTRGALETGTNAISRAHFAAAARGRGGAALHGILNDLLTGKRAALAARLAAIDHIGHCSGWDALAGATIALRAYFSSCRPRSRKQASRGCQTDLSGSQIGLSVTKISSGTHLGSKLSD